MTSSAISRFWKYKDYGILFVLLLILNIASVKFVQREITPFYPLYLDQNGYLAAAYAYDDLAQKEGLWAVIQGHFSHRPNLGFLPSLNTQMSLAGSWVFAFTGQGRLAALSIHLISWSLLLVSVYFAIKKITHHSGYALAACAFMLCLKLPFVGAGGMVDFRMDFPATCWMGISVALWTLFLHRPKASFAWLATGAMAVLIFFRIISLAYLVAPMGLVGLMLIHSFVTGRRKGLRRAIFPLAVFTLLSLAFILWDWKFLRMYYFDTQLGSDVSARGFDKVWDNFWEALAFYPRSLIYDHFGIKPMRGLIVALFLVVGLFFFGKKFSRKTMTFPVRWTAILFCLSAALFPLVVLIPNPTRAPQVSGVCVTALALTGFLIILALRPRRGSQFLTVASLIFLVAATNFWIHNLARSAPFPGAARQDAEGLNAVFASSFRQLTKDPAKPAKFAVLDFQEALIGYGIWFYGREHLHSDQRVDCIFPLQVTNIDEKELLAKLHQAGLVIVPREPNILTKRPYPISRSMFEHFAAVRADLNRTMSLQSSFTYEGVLYDIFVPQ